MLVITPEEVLIVPSGIETESSILNDSFSAVLIVPSGIETKMSQCLFRKTKLY